ncbi:MAG: hypothetical protein ACXVWZ_02000 [Nocardioides sp.]
MLLRRNIALTASALVLAATPVLSSCGFNYATDRVYTPAAGVNDRDAAVDVLAAVIVSAQDGSGTFIASFANNNTDKEASVDSITGAEGTTLDSTGFTPVTVPAGGLVNLAGTGQHGFALTGDFKAGDFVPLTIAFGDGDQVTMKVPVVKDAGDYTGLDISGSASASPSTSPSDAATPSDSATASASASSTP